MDKFPLLLDGGPSGELTAEREALYTWFTARCPLPEEEGALWCAWAVGDRGDLRLGVLEPQGEGGGPGMIRRRFSRQMIQLTVRIFRSTAFQFVQYCLATSGYSDLVTRSSRSG